MSGLPAHDFGCRHRGEHSDAAKRCSDAHGQAVTDLGPVVAARTWLAIRLEDGACDGVRYERRQDAVRAHSDGRHWCYVRINPGGMNPCQAEAFMDFARKVGRSGFAKMVDPDDKNGGRQLIPRLTAEEQAAVMNTLRLGR